MKRKLICLTLAAAMVFSNMGMITVFADDNWQSGWTGKEGGSDFTVTADETTVVMENTKVNNGKFSNDEDSIIYYANEINSDVDFTLSAKVNIDAYSMLDDSSNSQQGSVGIGVLDSLYHKTDDFKYDDGIYLGSYGAKKDADMAITAISRADSAEKTIGETLSDSFASKGENLGTFDLSIKKTGNTYTLSCGDKSQTIEMTAFEDEIYPCLYIARNSKATFTDVSLETITKKAVSLSLEGEAKTKYVYGEEFDTTGLKGVVTYDDGSQEETEDFLVKNFNPKQIGSQTVTLASGAAEATVEVEVASLECTALELINPPLKTSYAKNETLRTEGLEVQAEYSDGTKKTLSSEEYTLSILGKEIKDGGKLTSEGRKNVEIKLVTSKGLASTKIVSFPIEISSNPVGNVTVTPPAKTVYYLNDEFDPRGMELVAEFATKSGSTVTEALKSSEYTVSGFDSSSTGEKTMTVTPVSNPQVKAEFTIEVRERQTVGIDVTKYPRTTYVVGESFDDSDMIVVLKYDNGDEENIDYTVDTSKFDSSSAGTTSVIIKAEGYKEVELPVTIVESMENKWRDSRFGQASDYGTAEDTKVTAEEYGTVNGTINVRNWNGTGKITNDQDGMTYYFTSVKAENDFRITADIKVNKYLEHDNDDTKRNGQEAFGIMIRDAVPLENENGDIVINEADAKHDTEGVAVPANSGMAFASNMAILGGYSGTGWPTDPSKSSYEKNKVVNKINLLVREGVEAIDGGGTRIGPYAVSSDFPKEGNSYRLTMERMNGGIYTKCYNYQTEETIEKYYYDDSFLFTQNPDNYYVGFFGARWADIDVSNVSFYETNRATDQTIENAEAQIITPQLTFKEKTYSTSDEYTFRLSLTSGVKGRITVKMNNTIIAQDQPMDSGTEFTAKLVPDSENKLVAVFTPSDACNLTSYAPLTVKESIYQKDVNTASEIYAAPDGTFDGKGTYDSPYDLDTAVGILQPGQTLTLKEGVYNRTEPITIYLGDNGKEGAYKTIQAEEGKSVALDGQKKTNLVSHSGDYWYIKNIEFRNSGDNLKAYHLGGSHNIIEGCVFHDNGDLGFQMSRVSGSQPYWPYDNLIKDCESYNNCDPSMINADGFGAKLTVGEGNRFVNCKSHHNVDDGWDLYTKMNSGPIGVVTLENCEAYKNGLRLNEDGTETPYGAGGNNGFKMGGENVAVQHILINCKTHDNLANGLTTNYNPTIKIINLKTYNNGAENIKLFTDKADEYNYDVQGIVSYNGAKPDEIGSITVNTEYSNASATPLLSEINYWVGADGKSVNSNNDAATEDMIK